MNSVIAIIVNYNSGAWLERCLNSLIASEYPVEVYVVDNASTDDSLMLCRSLFDQYPNLHLQQNTLNLGFAKANNQVLNTTDADYYVLVNPDCMVEKQTVGYLVEMMQQDHHVGLAGTRILNEDGTIQKTSKRRFPTLKSSMVRVLGLGNLFKNHSEFADFDIANQGDDSDKQYVEAISGAFMMVSDDALDQVGGLDEGYFMHCEDLDWCKRVWLHGMKVAYYPGASVTHGKGKSSQANPYRVNWHLHQGMLRFYSKFYKQKHSRWVSLIVYLAVMSRLGLTNTKLFVKRLVLNK